ncbi:hypothetical protein TrRE_jg327 [Triparma retinervis]|uniref:Methyltransferase type 11 domain-containing protein n=1 Tax=Triparma retinervis TaxID=2557542 RepID=A0A9W6Z9B7_9STRA|nr:hypothetical protein TrRE_jg327 [Triparma retinervis]
MPDQKPTTVSSQVPSQVSPLPFYCLAAVTATATLALSPFLLTPMLPRRLFGALPYQHTPREKLDVAFKLLSKHGALAPETSSSRRRLKFVDLGSGAGEAVLMASRKGFDALGVEINPTLLAISQASRLFSRTNPGTARFSSSNLLTLPYSSFDVIFLFGVKPLLSQLEPKLINEVKPSGHLLLYRFTLPATAAYNDKYEILERDGEMTLYRRVVEQT